MKVVNVWNGLKINLDELSDHVCRFFAEKGFKPRKYKYKNGFRVYILSGEIYAEILSSNSKLEISLILDETQHLLELLGYSLSFIIGGGLFLRKLKLKELFNELERDFWKYLNKTI